MPEPTDTTTARRTLLALLLDRVERGALLPGEAPLIRPLVLADQADTDRAEQAEDLLRIAHETSNRSEATVYRLRQAVREARAAAPPGSELNRFADQMTAILDTPSTPTDDAPWFKAAQQNSADALYEAAAMLQHIGSGTWAEAVECVEARAMAYDRSGGRALALVDLRQRVAAALTAEHYRRARERVVASPEEHSAAMAAVAVVALVGPSPDDASPTRRVFYRANDGAEMHAACMDGQAALARVRALLPRIERIATTSGPGPANAVRAVAAWLRVALDGPSPTPDDAPAEPDDGMRPASPAMQQAFRDGWNNAKPTPVVGPVKAIEVTVPMTAEAAEAFGFTVPTTPDDAPTPVLDALRAGQPVTVTRCSPLVNPKCPGHTDGTHCDRAPSSPVTPTGAAVGDGTSHVTDWATSTDEQCPARYTGDSPHISESPWPPVDYRCERRTHGPDSNHAIRQPDQGTLFCWTDAIALYPTDDAPSEPQS